MTLLTEMLDGWWIDELVAEIQTLEEQYRNLGMMSTLMEGVLDDLPDEMIEKVSEIEKRLDAASRARELLTKLKQSGGYSADQVKKMRGRVSRNVSKLRGLLDDVKADLEKMSKAVNTEVKMAAKTAQAADDDETTADPELPDSPDVELNRAEELILQAFVRNRQFSLNRDDDRVRRVINSLEDKGLITDKGEATEAGFNYINNQTVRSRLASQ